MFPKGAVDGYAKREAKRKEVAKAAKKAAEEDAAPTSTANQSGKAHPEGGARARRAQARLQAGKAAAVAPGKAVRVDISLNPC